MATTPQTLSSQDFAAKIRLKYPGAYDRLSDDELTSAVLAKYPQYGPTVKSAPTAFDPDAIVAEATVNAPATEEGPIGKAWKWLNTGLLSPETATSVVTKASPPGLVMPTATYGQMKSVRDAAPPPEGGSPTFQGVKAGVAGVGASAAETLSGFTSPLSLATMGLGAATKIPGVVGKLSRAVTPLVGAGFGVAGAGQVAEGVHEGLDTPEGANKALLGLSQVAGGAAQAGVEGKRLTQGFANRASEALGLDGKLAQRVNAKVAQADVIRQKAAAETTDVDQRVAALNAKVQGKAAGKVSDVEADTSRVIRSLQSDLDGVTQQTQASLAGIQNELSKIPGKKLGAAAAITQDAAHAVALENARVQAPFVKMGEMAKTPVTDAPTLRDIITAEVKAAGANPEEIPPAAFRALGDRGAPEEGSTGGGLRIGDLSPEQQASVRAAHPDVYQSDDIGFRDLTRVKDDLYQAARASKDPQVRMGLNKALQSVIDMQEKYADANGFGDQYRKAKSDYAEFKNNLGNGTMDDFLFARDVEGQDMARHLSELSKGANPEATQALRTLLKVAGVDVSPLDDLIAYKKNLKASQPALEAQAKATTKGLQGQIVETQRVGAKSIAELQQQQRAASVRIARGAVGVKQSIAKGAEGAVAELRAKSSIVKGVSDWELVGKSESDIARMKFEEQAAKSAQKGINYWALTAVVYGLGELMAGSPRGGLYATLGATRLAEPIVVPRVLRNPTFQDWVIKRTGVPASDVQAQNRMRAGIRAMIPVLQAGAAGASQAAQASPAARESLRLGLSLPQGMNPRTVETFINAPRYKDWDDETRRMELKKLFASGGQ